MLVAFSQHLLARSAVHHGEQVVGPDRRVARPEVAMGDEFERADCRPRLGAASSHVPHRHAVGA